MTTKLEAELAISSIEKHPKNPRHRAVADVDMVASVREHGLVQPVVVAPHADKPAKYILIAGHRRLDAAKKAKLKAVPAIIREDLAAEGQQIEAMITENGHRLDLTPIEEAEGYAQLELLGYKAPAIAAAVGRDVKTVRARLKLLKLAPSTKKKVHAGQLNLDDAAAFVEFADDPAATKRLESTAKSGYDFKYTIQQLRRDRDARQRIAADVAKLLDRGATEIKLKDNERAYGIFDYDRGPVPLSRTHTENWDQHKDCLGFIQENRGEYGGPTLTTVCTKPATHKEQLDADERARIEAHEREEREADARAQAEDIAAQLRTETVMALVGTNTVMPGALRDIVRALLPVHVARSSGQELETYQRLMNVPEAARWRWFSDPQRDQVQNRKLRDHLEDIAIWSDGILTRALVAILLGAAESNVIHKWARHDDQAIAYLELLREAGHEFCSVDDEIRDELNGAEEKAS